MAEPDAWQRATQAAEHLTEAMETAGNVTEYFAESMIRLKAAFGLDGYTFAAEAAGMEIIPGTLRVVRHIWLRRPKSKKSRQWKKWQRLHAEKYCRVIDLLSAVC